MKMLIDKEWLLRKAEQEGDMEVGVGCLYCANEPERHWIETLNNGPIVPCPSCNNDGKIPRRPFYGAQCPSYPDCKGGCGLGCTKEIEHGQ